KTIRRCALGLRRDVAKQLFAAGDGAVAVAVQSQEGVVVTGRGPGYSHRLTIATNIECNAILGGGQMKALALCVNDDGGGTNHRIGVIIHNNTACPWQGVTWRWRSKRRIEHRTTRYSVGYFFSPHVTWREGNTKPNTV